MTNTKQVIKSINQQSDELYIQKSNLVLEVLEETLNPYTKKYPGLEVYYTISGPDFHNNYLMITFVPNNDEFDETLLRKYILKFSEFLSESKLFNGIQKGQFWKFDEVNNNLPECIDFELEVETKYL
jgi:hypothetical protein